MILGVGDRVREDAEIVNHMKLLDDETVVKDRFGRKKTRDIVDYIGEDIIWTDKIVLGILVYQTRFWYLHNRKLCYYSNFTTQFLPFSFSSFKVSGNEKVRNWNVN